MWLHCLWVYNEHAGWGLHLFHNEWLKWLDGSYILKLSPYLTWKWPLHHPHIPIDIPPSLILHFTLYFYFPQVRTRTFSYHQMSAKCLKIKSDLGKSWINVSAICSVNAGSNNLPLSLSTIAAEMMVASGSEFNTSLLGMCWDFCCF